MVKPIKEAAKFLWNGTIYAMSLPERYVRGLSALVGGFFKETTEILVPNLPLGGIESEEFNGVKKDFKIGDVMVMISDGLPELPNPSNDLLNYEKVHNCIEKNSDKSAEEIKDALVDLSNEWAKGVMNPDDITIVVIKKAA